MTVNKQETRRIKHNGFKGGLTEELEASDIPANTRNLCYRYVCITIIYEPVSEHVAKYLGWTSLERNKSVQRRACALCLYWMSAYRCIR